MISNLAKILSSNKIFNTNIWGFFRNISIFVGSETDTYCSHSEKYVGCIWGIV